MWKRIISVLAAAAFATLAWADEPVPVTLESLPEAVQKTIQTHLAKGKLTSIEKSVDRGEVSYDVEMKKGGRDRSMTVADDGHVIDMQVFLRETPRPVQSAIKAQAGENHIEEITKNLDDEEVTFEVDMTANGQERTFTVDAAGKLLDRQVFIDETPAPVQAAIRRLWNSGKLGDINEVIDDGEKTYEVEINPETNTKTITVDAAGRVLSEEDEISLATAPAAVQNTARNAIKDGRIRSVTKTIEGGEVSYDVEFRREGKTDSLSISPDGKPLSDR